MEYTEAYIDWNFSVKIAMQGTIARICHKYRDLIPLTSAYGMFGERSEGEYPIDRRGQEFHSLLRAYLFERECCLVNLEDMLKKQIHNMDQFRQLMDIATKRIIETELALVMIDDQKTQLNERIKTLEEPLKLEEKLIHSDIWAHVLEKTVLLQYDNIQKYGEDTRQLKKNNDELKTENEMLKMRIVELEAKQKEEESEEEDPEERIVYSSSDGLSYEEWEAKELKRHKEAERRDPLPLSCLKRIKRG
jgi:hypothetical protein